VRRAVPKCYPAKNIYFSDSNRNRRLQNRTQQLNHAPAPRLVHRNRLADQVQLRGLFRTEIRSATCATKQVHYVVAATADFLRAAIMEMEDHSIISNQSRLQRPNAFFEFHFLTSQRLRVRLPPPAGYRSYYDGTGVTLLGSLTSPSKKHRIKSTMWPPPGSSADTDLRIKSNFTGSSGLRSLPPHAPENKLSRK
jgi:hypothetical protein